jgi:heterotetrameric sarcosine oxidase gamma subunit
MAPRRVMATVQARKGQAATLATRIEAAFKLALPAPARMAAAGGLTAYSIAPATWLLVAPAGDPGFVARLGEAVAQAASIVDQSHGKALLRVSGARVRDCLDKICRLDLHPRAFTPDMCGITEIAHTAVLLARAVDGAAGAAPAFDLITPSTFAVHVLEAVQTAAAEFGCVLAS